MSCKCDEGFIQDSSNDCVRNRTVVASTTSETMTTDMNEMTTTASTDKVLVLSTDSYGNYRPAILINFDGTQKELGCFDYAGAEAYGSCSINWENQIYIFGGKNQNRQISRLDGFRILRIGVLAFSHWSVGACSVMGNKFIFLCFDVSNHSEGYNKFFS